MGFQQPFKILSTAQGGPLRSFYRWQVDSSVVCQRLYAQHHRQQEMFPLKVGSRLVGTSTVLSAGSL